MTRAPSAPLQTNSGAFQLRLVGQRKRADSSAAVKRLQSDNLSVQVFAYDHFTEIAANTVRTGSGSDRVSTDSSDQERPGRYRSRSDCVYPPKLFRIR